MTLDAAVAALRDDHTSGAVELAERASALLQQFCDAWQGDDDHFRRELAALCRALMAAQPSMASIINLCNTVMHASDAAGVIYVHGQPTPATIPQTASNAALKFSAFLAHHTRRIANETLPYIHCGSLLLTHSSSATVLAALLRAHGAGKRFGVVCTESRPQFDGVQMARRLAAAGIAVEVIADAAAALFIDGFYTLLIGADAISAEGVVNKVGTLGMALAAKSLGVPVYCLAGSEKLLPQGAAFEIVEQDPQEIVASQEHLRGFNLYFDQTPLRLISKFFTEDGVVSAEEIRARLAQRTLHARLCVA